ncbi:MAG: HD domain-containing protein [Candidatus Bathyarchaeia archaeon]
MLEQMGKSELDNLIRFLRMSGLLKRVPRSGWVEVGVDSPESVADHTFRAAILCMLFSDLEDLDGLKMMQMALLHDLPEAITGDLTPSEKTGEAIEREDAAMKQLLSLLPGRLRERYLKLWLEYAECKTKEARSMRELEKLEMALQAREYEMAQPSLKGLERFIQSADGIITSPEIRKLFRCILDSDR